MLFFVLMFIVIVFTICIEHNYQPNNKCDLKTRTLVLKNHIFVEKILKQTLELKSGSTSNTLLFLRVNITTL
jgi:hypothetical protein